MATYLAALWSSPEYKLAEMYDIDLSLATNISAGAECGNIPLNVVFAVIDVESTFNVDAVGGAGEIGLMQIKPSTARLDRHSLFDPVTNVCAGSKYLTKMYGQFGDLRHALAAYNAGPGTVARMAASGIVPRRYPDKVLAE